MEQMTLSHDGYIEIKQKIKEKLNETVHNFIIIGWYLKRVRDSGAFRGDGYKNMEEFAHTEYGLSAATASRFMDINTEFSKGGNSIEIKEEYRSFAYSKLQEMLTMAPEDRGLVTEKTTVQQIREIKKAEKEEREAEAEERQKDLPLLQTVPGHTEDEQESVPAAEPEDPFGKTLAAFWKEDENRELYTKVAAGMLTPGIAAEEICPSGSRTYRKGTDMLFFYDYERGLKLRGYEGGSPVITQHSYKELLEKTADAAACADATPHPDPEDGNPDETAAASQNDGQQKQTNEEIRSNPDEAVNSGTENVSHSEKNAIDGEYRELGSSGKSHGSEYTDEEIKNAINYFDIEYSRMLGLNKDTAKQRNYKIALSCIRKCHKDIAKQADRENYGGQENG